MLTVRARGELYQCLHSHCKKEMVILTVLGLSQLQLNDIMSPPSEGGCGDAHILAVQTLRLKDLVVCLLG